jgi:diguanylate cyclase (GGDEF)-like protein/PAS domain S-box-containing protein
MVSPRTRKFGPLPRDGSAPAALQDSGNAADLSVAVLFEKAQEAVLLVQSGTIVYANPKAREVIGPDLISRPLLQFIHKEEQAEFDAEIECSQSESMRIVSASGHIKWVRCTKRSLHWNRTPAELWFFLDTTYEKEISDEIRRKEEALRRVIDTTTQGFMLLDVNSAISDVNEPFLHVLGVRREDLLGSRLDSLYSRETLDFYYASRDHLSFEAEFGAKDGHKIPVLLNRSILRDEQGQVTGYMAFLTDLTELKLAQKQLQAAEIQYRTMYENAVQGMFQSTLTGALISANPAYARILGYETLQEILGTRDMAGRFYSDPSARQHLVKTIQQHGHVTNYELQLKRKDGQTVWTLLNARLTTAAGGEPIIEGILVDNTAIKRAEEELRHREEQFRQLAVHDNLTGLYNTRHLYHALSELVHDSSASGHPFSLIFMDMDNFKHVVDTYGHLNGSQALQEVAQTIQECISEPAFGVAYGGDEFVVVLPGVEKTDARQVAESIRDRIIQTVYLTNKGHRVQLRASFGVANFPQDAQDLSGLLALADQAMFAIKKRGKNAVGVSEPDKST